MAGHECAPRIDSFGRVPEYVELLLDAQARGECLLDFDSFMSRRPQDFLHDHNDWVLAKNMHPYPNTESQQPGVIGHMMIFPKRHIISPREMTSTDVMAQWQLFNDAADLFGANTGGWIMRFSFDETHEAAGATIPHIHSHIVRPHLDPETGRVPGFDSPESKQVKFCIG